MFENNINYDSEIVIVNENTFTLLKKRKINDKMTIRCYLNQNSGKTVIGLNHYLFDKEMLVKSETLIKLLENLNKMDIM